MIIFAKFMSLNCYSHSKVSMGMAKLFFHIYRSGYIDVTNRQHLQHILLQEYVSEEEKLYLDRILYAVRKGWVKVLKIF